MKRPEFLKEMTGDNNHRLLLWDAIRATKGKAVVEFGSGYGSTPYLKKQCKDTNTAFETYDNGEKWAGKHGSTFVPNNDWDSISPVGGVLLVDHAPGERRSIDIARLKDNFDIFVIHDSEPIGAGDYKYETIWHLFKYRIDVKTEGAWATAVSNKVDVTKWKDKRFGKYIIS